MCDELEGKEWATNRKRLMRKASVRLRSFFSSEFRTILEAYRDAGCPFGKCVDGMVLWYEYGTFTTEN